MVATELRGSLMVERPFGRALHDLLADREEFLTATGNINWRSVAGQLEGVHYESLRKCVAGERIPTLRLIEQVAQLAGVSPRHFVEYEMAMTLRDFDVREVGFESAAENVRAWAELKKKRR